jgi:PAS domain S-box-containing protein
VIKAGFLLERHVLPIAICGAGAALAWLAKEPAGLLVAVAGISVLGGRRASLLSAAVFGLALAAFVLAGWDDPSLRLWVFLAAGLGISGLVHLYQITTSSGRDEREARLIVESMPGHGWSADASGKFVYVSPSTLKYLGDPGENLDRIEGTDDFGWRQVVHPDDYDRVVARWLHSLKTGEPYENEHRIRRADGTYRWFRNSGMPSRDSSGRITAWYGTTIDIQDQKTAEFALRESERRLQQLIDAVPALIWSTTPEGTPAYVNKRFVDVTGANLQDLTAPDGSPSLSIIHPDDRDAAAQAVARSFKTGVPYLMRHRQRRRGGSYRWTETRAEPLRDGSGAILQWYGVSADIDDLVTAQEALRIREQELSQLVDMVPSHVWRLTPDGEPTFFNKQMADFLGLNVSDMGKSGMSRLAAVIETIHPDDAAAFRNAIDRCLATGGGFAMRYRLRRADGVYRWMSSRAEPMRDHTGCIVHWYGICHDIDDQMRADDALRERERQLQLMVDAIPAFIWCLTPEGTPSYFNKRVMDQIGLTVDDLTAPDGGLRLESVHPDDRPAVQLALNNSLKSGEPFDMKYRQRRGRADYRWTEGHAEPLRDDDGRIVQWYGVYSDIDDEVVAQQALREREQQLSQLVDMVPSLIWCSAPDGEPFYFNKRLIDFLGLDVTDVDATGTSRLAATIASVIHPDDAAVFTQRLNRSLQVGEPFSLRYRLRRSDGVYRWIEERAEPMRNRDGVIVRWYGLGLDVEDEIRTQEALRTAQDKLARATQAASLAELSASIAHEVNQPLAAIVATSHACRRWLSADPPNLERAGITLERIIRDANSASEVVSHIRALFSQMGKTRSPADISDVITEVCRLMAGELAARNIRVETGFDQSLPPTLIDRVQMQQVLVNLIRNAIDASDTVVNGRRLIRLHAALDSDNAIRVEVRDFGGGVKQPERIFEPFFTTKENGMGMGLAICRSIIEAHDGRLWAADNESRGTTVAFTLPLQARNAA